ncbi:MAG TPA: tRNA 2-thiouridine(34) synthase MnmA [Candidatus Paceibacterota bacterium]
MTSKHRQTSFEYAQDKNIPFKKKIFVGLSGGVDSAVSAALLKRVGADVVGAFIKTWYPNWLADSCSWRQERRDAMRVAVNLGIPFVTLDLEREYKREVVDYMITEYKSGHTPNPDVMCNKEIKFGVFLRKALAFGADIIATGHYAQNQILSTRYQLLAGKDAKKDQSYFLWTLNQAQLSKTILPVGHLLKSEVRNLAKQFKLPVANKPDSQGICFLGQVDIKQFLSHYVEAKTGDVLDESGKKLGTHDGAIFYTINQVWRKPYYVVAKNMQSNTISVSTKANFPTWSPGGQVKLRDINWISGTSPDSKKILAQIRYHGESLPCVISGSTLTFTKSAMVAPGQSVVIYDDDVCLGGGIIEM